MGSGLRFALPLAAAVLSVGGCGGSDASGPLVFAAASTADALEAAGAEWAARGETRPRFSFAASSTLARQVEAGAPAEVVVVADPSWMDHLERAQCLRAETRADIAGGRLVWIAPAPAALDEDRATPIDWSAATPPAFEGRLALGDPEHVPAGIYARQALVALGWWDELEERLAPAASVRAALRLVELGEARAGLVYESDAQVSTGVRVLGSVPVQLHDPVRYSAALTPDAGEAAARFHAFLCGAEGRRVLAEHGFRGPSLRELTRRPVLRDVTHPAGGD